jgi:hypothetical protein
MAEYDHAAVAGQVWEHLASHPGLTVDEITRAARMPNTRRVKTALAELERAGRVAGERVPGGGGRGFRVVWRVMTVLAIELAVWVAGVAVFH